MSGMGLHMILRTSIKCPKCQKHVAYAEDLTGYVIPAEGLKCLCGTVVVYGSQTIC